MNAGGMALPLIVRERELPEFIARRFSVSRRFAAALVGRHGCPATVSVRGVRYVTEEEIRAFLARVPGWAR